MRDLKNEIYQERRKRKKFGTLSLQFVIIKIKKKIEEPIFLQGESITNQPVMVSERESQSL